MSPDGSTKPPPEEKLLRLIRGKEPRRATEAASLSPTGEGTAGSVLAMEVSARGRRLPWPRLAVGGLGAVLLIEVVGLISLLMRPIPTVGIPTVATPQSSEPMSVPPPLPDVPSLAASASQALFAPTRAQSASPAPIGAMPSGSARQLASRLTLMGIVSGEPPQAIIEDSETKKTYFVTTGQAVVDGAILEQVLDNRVILSLQGEKIELTL